MMENRNEAPRFRVLELSWIDGDLQASGKEIVYRGNPGSNLEPLNAAAVAAVEKYGRRQRPDIPQLPEPSPLPVSVDWREHAIAAGWMPAPPQDAGALAQAPQPKKGDGNKAASSTETAKAGTGTSAADKLNPAPGPVVGQVVGGTPDPGI